VGITAGSREVLGRNACDKTHPYLIIIIIIIIIIICLQGRKNAIKNTVTVKDLRRKICTLDSRRPKQK